MKLTFRIASSPLTLLIAMFLGCMVAVFPALAQEGLLDTSPPKGITVEEIIQRFAAKEKEFKVARDQYTYRQDVKVMVMDGETVTGEYHEVFDVLFDDKGRRLEIAEYNVLYVGQQQEDELHCYVFDLAPKTIQPKMRYFQGRIWVDDHDYQIVKTYGQGVPEIRDTKKKGKEEHLYPKFTTWRQQIDGAYWFPTYTRADDTLHFGTGDIHIREIVKYEDYKRFGSNVKILYQGKELPKAPNDQKQPQNPEKKPDAPR